MIDPAAPPLGVYVHWPYCARICPYCDFNVYRNRAVDGGRWAAALPADLEAWRARSGPRRLVSIYFGGGTPSLAPPELIAELVATCRRLWTPADDLEVTLEANPTDAETARYRAFAEAGVGRLSLGVQSLSDAGLRFLGRDHDAAAARRAAAAALAAFPRVSVDLIYARPGETQGAWLAELGEAVALGADHLSLYQLTVEPGTAFARAEARGTLAPPSGDEAADLYEATLEATAAAGYDAYEVSNFARPGAQSRHNRLYWTGGDYVGVGPGAHGRLTVGGRRHASEAERRPEAYLRAVEARGHGRAVDRPLDPGEALAERVAMGLRLAEGVRLDPATLAALAPRADPLIADGFLTRTPAGLAASRRGRLVLDSVVAALLA